MEMMESGRPHGAAPTEMGNFPEGGKGSGDAPADGGVCGPPPRKGKAKKRWEWSKCITLLVILAGVGIVQECFVLMYLCIVRGYTSTAAWLTAAVGLAEAVIGAGLTGYLSLCKKDHSEGGITFESAKAKGFSQGGSEDSPGI